MARKKQRVFQHIMEDRSYEIIRKQIPQEWVIREFNRPDYGIDLVIELFEPINDEVAETLGEFIYVQVKAVKELEIKQDKIYAVGNVAKGVWKEDKNDSAILDVVKYSFDTNSLLTIQSLGGGVSVLLFLVDLNSDNVYFICLNDYIDKIILPQNPQYTKQETVTVKIPVLNILSNNDISNTALKFYGKRSKLLAAFSKFAYQKNEIGYLFKYKDFPIITYRDKIEKNIKVEHDDAKKQLLYFISQIEDLDIWKYVEWMPLTEAKTQLLLMKALLQNPDNDLGQSISSILILWHQLTNLGTMYEDICREWFLPKMISLLTSYPDVVINTDNKGLSQGE